MSGEKFSFGGEEKPPARRFHRAVGRGKTGTAAIVLGALGLGYVVMTAGDEEAPHPLDTSTADEFQGGRAGPRESPFPNLDADLFTRLRDPAPETSVPSPNPLQDEVDRLRSELAAGSGVRSGLAEELHRLNGRLDGLQADLERSRQEGEAARETAAAELEARLAAARAADEARLKQAEGQALIAETRAKQMTSKSIVFDQGKPGQPSDGPLDNQTASATLYNPDGSRRDPGIDERGRAFVDRARPVNVAQSGILANPGITLSQGTIIRATLDTALASNLPGQIVATVNTPVESMDGSRILVPPGARLFGEYQIAQGIGERRIQVAWSRILTPDGVSIELESFGADQLGRSGVTGRVDSRWGTRFAAAALISLIGIGPALLAENARSDTEEDAVTDMGQSLVTALAPTVSQYMTLPPIINVRQGAVTVIVNKDIEVLR
ncbi:TrbI/VirB10 family protein [Haematobacter genomosp. 1]|uniref:Conjugal transfer protein n=1 Tax=Haematobacter genomosp. 1 TaxID=366618 RepID=A0A212AAD6_9RHOB|nr:TrbI/VirB10 family protein [Haematobacter genomosp. 1]OWJ77140.1 hypothetical protein CDV49_12020 [Haematobacter genomosp. 1]